MAKIPNSPPYEVEAKEASPERLDRGLVWIGSSQRDLSDFDIDLKRAFGFQLRQVQQGKTPENAKPGEVSGTMKLVENDDTDTYRVVYTVKLKTGVYVLHAFKKKSNEGIATPEKDIKLVRKRLQSAGVLDKAREKEKK